MKDFQFYNPTRIFFGTNTIRKLNKCIPHDSRILITYGGGSAEKTGTLDEVRKALGERKVFEFGGIEANPQYATLMKAVMLAREENIDFLLAVGGGSVIDGTKFIAAAIPFEGEPWEILLQRGYNITSALPFGTVLTLPATGSEMNSGSVITNTEKHAKLVFHSHHVFPKFSILDPEKTLTLPKRQVVNGIIDAFVHIVEQYVTYPFDAKVQDRFAESLLTILVEDGPRALSEPDNLAVRSNLMWVATLALNGLIGVGVPQDWTTHMIGHELTALKNIDHARTLAIVLPGVWQVCRESKAKKLVQYAERVWNITEGSEDERIDAAIAKTEAFFRSFGVDTRLNEYGLGEKDVETIVRQLEEHKMIALGEHKTVTLERSREILRARL